MSLPDTFLQAQIITTSILVGLILVIQKVHYPSMHFLDRTQFKLAHEFHVAQISKLVIPLMLTELFCTIYGLFCFSSFSTYQTFMYLSATLCLLAVWLSTFFVQVPIHKQLGYGYDETLVSRLVATNQLRTAAWIIRLALLIGVLHL